MLFICVSLVPSCCCSVTQSCPSLWPLGLQHARLPCPSPTPGVYSNSCPLSRWCHSTISSSVSPFSSRLESFPATRSFPVSQLLASGSKSIGASALASVLPVNIQDWFPFRWTELISLLSKYFQSFPHQVQVENRYFIFKFLLKCPEKMSLIPPEWVWSAFRSRNTFYCSGSWFVSSVILLHSAVHPQIPWRQTEHHLSARDMHR